MPHVDEGTLHAYLDGELPSAERKTVEIHLAECASCRATLAEERALFDRASALLGTARPAERPAPPFEQLRAPRSPKRSPWYVRTSVAWAASIALALGIGYYLHEPARYVGPTSQHFRDRQDVATNQEQEQKPAPATRPRGHGPTPAAPAPAMAQHREPDSVPVAAAEQVAGGMEHARTDAGAAKTTSPAELRNAAPAPIAASIARDSLMASGAVARTTTARGRATTTSWPIISNGAARSLLGTAPVGLPGLARKIRRSPTNDGTVVVEQQIDSATMIQIFQRQNGTMGYAYDTAGKA
jgi:hypothetical protein